MFSVAALRSKLTYALELHESPHRTALAFAVGVFIAFSPTYGLHTVSVIFLAWLFRLNFFAVLAGALINNPWTIVPILGVTFWTGFAVLGMPQSPSFTWNDLSLEALYETVLPYALPFFLGGFLLSLVGAFLSYPVALALISKYRRIKGHPPSPGDMGQTSEWRPAGKAGRAASNQPARGDDAGEEST